MTLRERLAATNDPAAGSRLIRERIDREIRELVERDRRTLSRETAVWLLAKLGTKA